MGLTYGVGEQKPATGVNVRNDQLGAKALWSKSLETMQAKTTPDNSQQWLTDLRFVAEVNNAIVVAAPDQLTLDRVVTSFERPLQQAWQEVDPKRRKLKFELWTRIPADVRDVVGDPWLNDSAMEADAAARNAAESEDESTVIGHVDDDEMVFLKTYQGLDLESIYCEGKIVERGRKIVGKWYFSWPNEISGTFEMNREPADAETHQTQANKAPC